MKYNADLTERAVENVGDLPWTGTPVAGVERRMLERDGDEVARATSVVRFAPKAHFPRHSHGGGEEILVLDGVFSDEFGEYPAGTYLRNPPGSSHAPYSETGCTLFVKLRQMADDEAERLVRGAEDSVWQQTTTPTLFVKPLFDSPYEQVALFRFEPGAALPRHRHPLGIEIFVLDGALSDEVGRYEAGTWLRNPGGTSLSLRSDTGSTVYVKTGHLPAAGAKAA